MALMQRSDSYTNVQNSSEHELKMDANPTDIMLTVANDKTDPMEIVRHRSPMDTTSHAATEADTLDAADSAELSHSSFRRERIQRDKEDCARRRRRFGREKIIEDDAPNE
jgi:hypothetical protein